MNRRAFIEKTSLAGLLTGLSAPAIPAAVATKNSGTSPAESTFDLVIVGGTPAGIMAAIAAGRMGYTSMLLERTAHVGGLPANGLGATDIATRGATGGLFLEFVQRVYNHYVIRYGQDAQQVKDCSDGYHFEPSVGEKVLLDMLREQPKVTVLTNRQFDFEPENVTIRQNRIQSVHLRNRTDGKMETYTGKCFLDATYEGDLIAAAGVPFFVGREGKQVYNEPGAGRLYKYWHGEEGPGSTYQGDNSIQSFNYRLCLTKDPSLRSPIPKPANYRREEYVSLIEDVLTGNHTGVKIKELTDSQRQDNVQRVKKGTPPVVPGMPEGIARLTNMVTLPNGKTDANNQHFAFISTDLPEENWPWPTSGWDWRDQFARRQRDYTNGLFWFAQHDPELPGWFKEQCQQWGYAKDEYTDNGNFPRQVYVREGRRMKGKYFFTAKDAQPLKADERPPIHANSITSSHYAIDSHAVRKREPGRIHLDGFLSYPTQPYTVPYGVIVPDSPLENLLGPVPVSGSHIGFSTLRMEPCWMALGQAAGVAAGLSIKNKCSVAAVPIAALQQALIAQKAVLIHYTDMKLDHPHFAALQFMGLKGVLPQWEAKPDQPVSKEDAVAWQAQLKGLSAITPKVAETRGQYLQRFYEAIRTLPAEKVGKA